MITIRAIYRSWTLVFWLLSFVPGFRVSAQDASFTYQGRLNDGLAPASGTYDLRFAIYDGPTAGTRQGNLVTNANTVVSNGLFTVALDFGNQFPGANRWLEVSARTNGGGAFMALNPRQKITATPYATTAGSLSGALPATGLSGTYANAVTLNNAANSFSGDGAGLLNVNATTLEGMSSAGFWKTNGNSGADPGSGALLGTTDEYPLELKVNNWRALRLEPTLRLGTVNVIGGALVNSVDAGVWGATIAGGGDGDYFSEGSRAYTNRVQANFGTVSGGRGNRIQSSATSATIGGGNLNTIQPGAIHAVIGGGDQNTVVGSYGTVPGGRGNNAADYAFAAGQLAKANHSGAFVWSDASAFDFASTAANQFLVRAAGGVGIGTTSPQGSLHVYSTNNPTVVRIQSAGTPGFGRVEFVSNPRGDVNEWRPGYIQSTDNGGFVGGLGFFVNGAGSGSKFGSVEVMRVVNGAVGIGTITPVSALHVVGTVTATTFNPPSDRNLKENFAPVNTREVLEKVAALPISRWNFQGDAATTHVGPMAQDFHAAFAVGTDDRHIATVDADGVALAAIQGLNQKLEQQNAELKRELAELRKMVQQLTR